jgi:hypothetical protein
LNIQDLVLERTEEQLDVALHRLLTANYNLNGREPKIATMHTINGLLIEEALISLGAECGDGIAWDLTLPDDKLKYDVKFAAEGLKSAHGFVRYYSRLLYTARYSQATGLIAGEPLSFTEERVVSPRGKFRVNVWKTAKIFYVGPLVL